MNKLPLLLLPLAAALLPIHATAQNDLSQYRGRNRLLLIFAPSASDPRWRRQNALLADSRAQFTDRDLLRFDFLEHGRRGEEARARYGVKPGQFRVLLIGKDGHVASGGPTPISLADLSRQIDRMPMRQAEMRRRGR